MKKFLEELTELSNKHGLYIRGRHETDWWYAPLLVDSEKGERLRIVADSFYWDEDSLTYDVDEVEDGSTFTG